MKNEALPRPFGPYQLLRRLAVGGMAEVYAAKAEGLGGFEKLVALKVIHPRISEDEHFVQMLVDEAKLSVLLHHANIAQTFDLGFAEGRYFIVMEYVEGLDAWRLARKMIARGAQLPIEAAVYIVTEMLAGLEYAHTKSDPSGQPLRIVHRDVSPQNVLISLAGEVKLADFGIAKASLRASDTEVGVIKGKYDYMSPEQAWADPVDRRSDVFSAGVVLHELLTGRSLYQEDSVPALLDKVRRARIPRPSRIRPEVPAELDAVCLRALARRPEDRFQTAGAFADALSRVLYGLDPGYGGPTLARILEELQGEEGERLSQHTIEKASRTTLPRMRRQDFVPAPSSIVHAIPEPTWPTTTPPPPLPEGARQAESQAPDDDPDETGVFEGPLPSMSFPTPAPPRSGEASALTAALAKNALRAPLPPAPPPPGDDDETSVFDREKSLLALGFPPEPKSLPPPAPGAFPGDDAPTPPRGTRSPIAEVRAKRRAPEQSPPSVEVDPTLVLEAQRLARRAEANDESTVVDASGATVREVSALLAMASVVDEPTGERGSATSALSAEAATWRPPARSWEPLPFLGPDLPPEGLAPLPMEPAARGARAPGRKAPRLARAVGLLLVALVAAGIAVALAN